MARYYIQQTSWFQYGSRHLPAITRAVKAGGGKNVRSSNQFGWSNQPRVVTFDATPTQLPTIEKTVKPVVHQITGQRTWGVLIRKKDW